MTPADAKAHAARARQYVGVRDWAKAAKSLHVLSPADTWRLADLEEFEFRFLYGQAMGATGRPVVGEVQLKRAVEISPQSAPAHYQLGMVRRILGRTVEAERDLRRAAELDPDRSSYRLQLAGHLMETDRHSEAERQLNILLEAEPENRAARDLRVRCRDALAASDPKGA
jgi:Flp pilus assembly protein TadD